MYSVTKDISFCYGHRLMNYDGPCRFLHGHSAKVEIRISGKRLDEMGMIRDFREVGEVVKRLIDRSLGHRMLLRHDDPCLPILRDQGEPVVAFEANPTAEAISERIFQMLKDEGFRVDSVVVWEDASSRASYEGTP